MAILPFASSSARSRSRTRRCACSIFCATSKAPALRSAAARRSSSASRCESSTALGPVYATMRRTPAAIDSSLAILKKAMSPVRRTCVPPQSSFDGPMRTTRTTSPYFSPKIIIAPVWRASSRFSTEVSVSPFSRTSSFTRRSTSRSSSCESGWKWEKSKRR